jgi:hypothetical protein
MHGQQNVKICVQVYFIELFLEPIWIKIYTMVQVELNNMYINIGANNGSEKLWTKKTATSGKLIKAVYASYGCVYILCTS